MAKQINIGIVTDDSEVETPPVGYVARYEKLVGLNVITHYKDSAGVVYSVNSGVSTVNGGAGIVNLASFDITQWIKTLPANISVTNGNTYNLLESLTDADKASVSATGSGAINITNGTGQDYILMNWRNVKEWLEIRIVLQLQQAGTDFFRIQLRRKSDDSVISTIPLFIDAGDMPEQQVNVNILSYIGSNADPFVTGGFYFLLLNNSGATVTITGNINLLINRLYQFPIAQ